MKAESAMWREGRPFLIAARLDPVRVENPIGPGTPDVNLADGRWIELKCVPAWPPSAETPPPAGDPPRASRSSSPGCSGARRGPSASTG